MKMKAAIRLRREIRLRDAPAARARGAPRARRPKRDGVAHGFDVLRAAEGFEPERAEQRRLGLVRIAGVDGGDDREARPQRHGFQHILGERDAHRDALHDLGEIAGRVVGRQQRELRPRGRRDRLDHALDDPAVERVDGDVDFLPRLDARELGLLEIGVDIGGVERHQRHQPGSRLHELADLGRLVADRPVEGSEHAGERQIALRHLERGHELVALALRPRPSAPSARRDWPLRPPAPPPPKPRSPWRRRARRRCGRGRRSPARAAAASRNWSERA